VSSIDPNLIAAFLDVASSGNISAAASRQRLTPSALSQKIKALENQVGKSLFTRKRTGVVLNREGESLQRACLNFQKDLKSVANWIDEHRGTVSGEVRITMAFGLFSYEMPGFMKIFTKKNPDVFIVVKGLSSSAEVEEAVLNGDSDIGMIVGGCRKPSLKTRCIMRDNSILMVCSPDYYLAGKKVITKEALKGARILWHGSHRNRSFQEICRKTGVSFYDNENKLSLPDMESCKKHVLQGIGVAFISEMYLREELKSGRVVRLPGFRMNKPLNLISRNEKYELSAVTCFKNELVKYCSKIDKVSR